MTSVLKMPVIPLTWQQFLINHDVPDPVKWADGNLKDDTMLFQHLITSNIFESDDYVHKWKEFVCALPTLAKTAWVCELYGETLKGVHHVRNTIVKFTGQEDDVHSRSRFAVWCVFMHNKTLSYLPLKTILAGAHKVCDDVELVMEQLITHPKYPKLYTSKQLDDDAHQIAHWLDRAECLDVEAPTDDSELDSKQKEAVSCMLSRPYTVIQGIAGSGKTRTICNGIRQLIKAKDCYIVAATFTHKAKMCIQQNFMAENIKESVDIRTIHSLIAALGSDHVPQEMLSRLYLVLDEASMIDLDLLATLAKTMLHRVNKYQLCFVGDCMQIQPVGRGEYFRWLCQAQADRGQLVEFLHCYRTNKQDLFGACMNVREGIVPPEHSDNFEIITVESDSQISSKLGEHISKHLNKYLIITWQNQHMRMINIWVQKALLAARKIGPKCFHGFYMSDRVVYTGENNDKITNALLGTVQHTTLTSIGIMWDGGSERSTYTATKDIQLAYAISAHKSQGSEYPNVLVAMYEMPKMMACMDRRWFYTSITRGREKVKVITTGADIAGYINKPLDNIPTHDMTLCKCK